MNDDYKIVHYPLLFVQGEEAYELIEQCDNDLESACENLTNYIPNELPEPVEGEPKSFNYRFFHHFKLKNKSYRLAYTTGDGGMLSLDQIVYGDEI